MSSVSKHLAAHPLFSHLNQSDITELSRIAIPRQVRQGEHLAWYGDIWPYLFLVVEGSIQAIKESIEGRALLVATFEPGELFWGLAFFHEDAPMPVTLEARGPCQVYLFPRERLMPLLLKSGQLSWELCRRMARQMLKASAIVEEQTFYPIDTRLARMLIESFESAGDDSVARSMTLDEMAARIGSTREMVCRTLHQLADRNLIKVTRTEFSLVDKEGLAELADKE